MARHPALSAAAEQLPLSIFARLMERLAGFEGDIIPLQIGDTHLPPPAAARLGALGFGCDHDPQLYAYSKPRGDDALIEAIVTKVRERNGMSFARADNVQITSGATHALSCALRATLDPGDQILLPAPYWPLIRSIALSCGVTPVEVPLSQALLADPEADVGSLIEPYITPRTRAMYLCTPNNPDGKVLSHSQLRGIAQVVLRHKLWVVADEVYESFVYDRRHESVAAVPGMAEHTLTAFSFSKSYAQAGLRVGYVVGPEDAVAAVRKISNATIYSVSRAMQRCALAALVDGDEFLAEARERYRRAREVAVDAIEVPTTRPEGSTYLFLDLRPFLAPGEESALCLLERMAEAGLLLAPGHAFGRDFGPWARLCFTAVDEDRLREGIDRLNNVLREVKGG